MKDCLITFRTTSEILKAIKKIAEDKEWTISQTVEKIIKQALG